MQELIGMLRNKLPEITTTRWWRANAHRFPHQVASIQRLRFRRPDLYEAAMTALVNWIVEKVEADEVKYA